MSVLLTPVTPRLSQRIYEQLGLDFRTLSWRETAWGTLKQDKELPQPAPVFQRLEGDYVISAVEVVAV